MLRRFLNHFAVMCLLVIGLHLMVCLNEAHSSIALNVPLTIREVAGIDRVGEPCSTGVPLPLELLQNPNGLAVFDSNDNPVPAQFKVLERWREAGQDGSIKWMLVTFLPSVSANSTATYYLREGTNPAPAEPVSVVDNSTSYSMAGKTFMKDFSSPFKLVLTESNGTTTHYASDLSTITWSIEENGPVRTMLKAESQTEADKFGFIAWIYGYAGQSRWDMTIVLKNTPRTPRGPFYFKDFSVAWDYVGSDYVLGGDEGQTFTGTLGETDVVYLYQDSSGTDRWDKLGETGDGRAGYVLNWTDSWQQGIPSFRGYKVRRGQTEIGSGNHALGWASLGNATISVRHFWQNHPMAMELKRNRITARLFPKYWTGHGGVHWIDDLQRKAYDISFQTGSFSEEGAKAFNCPLVAHCGLDWYRSREDVMGYISTRYSEETPNCNNTGNWEYNWLMWGGSYTDRIRRRIHEFPMHDFIRTSDPYHAYKTSIAMRHSAGMTPMWLDSYSYPADVGVLKPKTYCNTARPLGTYTSVSDRHGYMPWNPEHWTAQELFDGWRLFGDPLAYDALEKMGTYLQFYVDYRKTNPPGETRWDALPMYVLCEIYRITGDSSILTTIEDYLDVIWHQINKDRGYYAPNASAEIVEKVFMVSRLIDGLHECYLITGDERAFDIILGTMDYCINESYVNRCYGFLYETPIDPDERDAAIAAALETDEANCTGDWTSTQQGLRAISRAYMLSGLSRYNTIFQEILQGVKDTNYYNTIRTTYLNINWDSFCDKMDEDPRTDTTPPLPITDLNVEVLSPSSVKLTWTVPVDAVRYQVKYSSLPMVDRIQWPSQASTHSNWWAAENVHGEPTPGTPGSTQEFTVSGLEPGVYYFAVRSYDASSNMSTPSNMPSVVVSDYFAISTVSLPDGTQGQQYNETLSAIGGTEPYSWSITSGSLPNGLMLDGQNGNISGTPTQPGIYDFTLSVADSASLTDTENFSITIDPADTISPTITSVTPSEDPTRLIVVYSEQVEDTSATTVSNYDIDNAIIIFSASLGSDLKTVTLMTSPHSEGITYTLIVNNVLDMASNPNPIADNTQANYAFIPQVTINNLTVTSGEAYEVVEHGLQNGSLVYMDRTYTFTTVPDHLKSATYIKTAGNDNSSEGDNFFSFEVDQAVTVYVAHADQITSKPSWLTAFNDTGSDISISTDAILSVFSKDFPAGTITLGGNEGEGLSMYTVIIVPSNGGGIAAPTGLKITATQ